MTTLYRVDSFEAIQHVAKTLMDNAKKSVVKESPHGGYSKTFEEAEHRALQARPELEELHISCGLIYQNRCYSVVVTVDAYEEKPCWHMSIGEQAIVKGTMKPLKASDEVANLVAKAFFGGNFKEGGPEGFFSLVRHFFQEISDEDAKQFV